VTNPEAPPGGLSPLPGATLNKRATQASSEPAPAGPSAPPVGSSASSGSAVAQQGSQRPMTRLQQGIHKPKVYTISTIRYGHLVVVSPEPTVDG
jgi:hypothetical protein